MFKLQRHRDIFIKRRFFTINTPPRWYKKFNSNNPPTDEVIGELARRFTTDDFVILRQHGFDNLHALFNDAAIDPWVVHRIVNSKPANAQIKLLVRQIVTVTNQSLITPKVVEYVRSCVGINDTTSYEYCPGDDYSVGIDQHLPGQVDQHLPGQVDQQQLDKWIIAMQQLNHYYPVLFGRHYLDDEHKFRLDDPLYVACEVARELVVGHINDTGIKLSDVNTDRFGEYKQIIDDFLVAVGSRFDNLMAHYDSDLKSGTSMNLWHQATQ